MAYLFTFRHFDGNNLFIHGDLRRPEMARETLQCMNSKNAYLSLDFPTSSGPNSKTSEVRMYFLCAISSFFFVFFRCGNTILSTSTTKGVKLGPHTCGQYELKQHWIPYTEVNGWVFSGKLYLSRIMQITIKAKDV